ncbi:alpha/beta hydrolase [Neorhizobium sp. JUb45]|uniref:alpha/beta fold hydrolase n=1 Tax=Neorhizobium sp. JUb45 TaxID=2485113 RepID=UPI0010F02FBF|nr:alpha/beta hydrolase [Neorhizobium sp. JUb45]TCQ99158.1 microsomal epoxide hydrolase/non-specific protein-tyrosine kinase [Neorhizobium sp. JUb45]
MLKLTRRALLAGFGAVASATAFPAMANQGLLLSAMPPVRMVAANGINLAVYESGSGPAVVLLHGFPGLAYTWRYQIPALVAAGYRVIVPDLRGYGLSDRPEAVEAYDLANLTGDVVGLLDALDVEKAVFMGHDFGGLLSWQMALFHRERTAGVISLNTPHIPHWMLWLHTDLVAPVLQEGQKFVADPGRDPIAQMREVYSPHMYVLLFQDGDAADTVMNSDPRGTLRGSLRKNLGTPTGWDQLPAQFKNMEYYGQPTPDQFPGQDVLNSDELEFYVRHYNRTGFTPAINWYRNITRNWKAGLDVDQTIRVPSLMVSAANDVVLRSSMTDGMDACVPDLEKHVVADAWHWTAEEQPDAVNRIAVSWLHKRFPPGGR